MCHNVAIIMSLEMNIAAYQGKHACLQARLCVTECVQGLRTVCDNNKHVYIQHVSDIYRLSSVKIC